MSFIRELYYIHTTSSVSWAYAFVRINGETNEISNKKINKSVVIGIIIRHVEEMDHGSEMYGKSDLDSNE
jgi:hypothetical protein